MFQAIKSNSGSGTTNLWLLSFGNYIRLVFLAYNDFDQQAMSPVHMHSKSIKNSLKNIDTIRSQNWTPNATTSNSNATQRWFCVTFLHVADWSSRTASFTVRAPCGALWTSIFDVHVTSGGDLFVRPGTRPIIARSDRSLAKVNGGARGGELLVRHMVTGGKGEREKNVHSYAALLLLLLLPPLRLLLCWLLGGSDTDSVRQEG